jgi:hypothetical protein
MDIRANIYKQLHYDYAQRYLRVKIISKRNLYHR